MRISSKFLLTFFYYFYVIINNFRYCYARNSSAEHRLYRHLIKSSEYLKTMRPVRNHTHSISVKLGMCIMMLEDIVERDQTMMMSVCIKMKWMDEFLQWDPDKFDGLRWMAVPVTDIWQPDIALVNSAEPYALTRKPAQADITNDGSVGYYPAGRMATKCSLDITYFPMDFQRCEVRFESWVYPLSAIDIEEWDGDMVDIKDLYTNHLWTIAHFYVIRDAIRYDELKFARLKFVFELKRKPLYFFTYIILPLLLLSALQTLGHTLPVEHPGRMAMLTALFIGSSVTQSSIASHVPKTSEVVSLIQIYSTIVNVTLFVSMVISFIMLYTLLRLPSKEPSFWVLVFNFFSITWSTRGCRKVEMPPANSAIAERLMGRGGSTIGGGWLGANSPDVEGLLIRQRSLIRQPSKVSVGEGGAPVGVNAAGTGALLTVHVNSGDSGYATHPRRPTTITTRQNSGVMPNWIRAMYSGEYPGGRKVTTVASGSPSQMDRSQQQGSNSATPVSGQQAGGNEAFVAIDIPSDQQGEGGLLVPALDPKKLAYKTDTERRKAEAENAERHKKRWLIYCVALDKSIMYGITVWNVFVPIILFISIPRIQTFDAVPPGVERTILNI